MNRTVTDKKTLVVILGWAGAKNQSLTKFCNLYQNHGYSTMSFIASSLVPGWGVKNSRNVINLSRILKKKIEDPSIRLIFHCFSMNGFLTLCALELQFPNLKIFGRCDGLFLDSCPMHTADFGIEHIRQHCIAMDNVYGKGLVSMRGLLKRLITLQYILASLRDKVLVKIGAVNLETVSAFHYTLKHPNLPPVISLVYSEVDLICLSRYMDEWKNDIAKRGQEIVVTCHKDSIHCGHFKKHPEEYTKQVEEFIRMVEKVQKRDSRSKI